MSGAPDSFGRAQAEDVVEKPEPDPVAAVAGGMRVVDGRLVVDVEARLVLGDDQMQGLYDQIRDLVALAVADGMATGRGRPLPELDEVLPGGGPAVVS